MEVPFTGEASLLDYVQQLCAKVKDLPVGLLLIDTSPTTTIKPKLNHFPIAKYILRQLKCANAYHVSYSNVTELNQQFQNSQLLKHHHFLQAIFNINPIPSNSSFHQLLISLSILFKKCINCLPFILTVNGNRMSRLTQWTSAILNQIQEFRLTIVESELHQSESRSITRAVHLNPVLDGCLQYSGLFVPKSVLDFNRLKAPYSRCNLNATTLNVSVSHLLPYCNIIRNTNGTIEVQYAMETELLKTLARKFNFKVNFLDGKQLWGSLVNGSWTGMVGDVLSYKSHLAMCEFTISPSRQTVIDYSRFILQNEITFMSQSPGLAERPWIVASPFGMYLWIIIITTVIALSTVSWLLHKYLKRLKTESFMDIISDIYCVPLQESTLLNRKETHSAMRFIIGIWIFTSLTLSVSYSSSFYSLLTIPEYDLPIDTVEDISDIASNDQKYLIVREKSTNWYQFLLSTKENRVYHLIGQHINRTGERMTKSMLDFMPKLDASGQYVLIANRIVLKIHRHQYANRSLHIGKENLGIEFTGYIFRKRSALRRPFNRIITRLRETALIAKWTDTTFHKLPRRNDPTLMQSKSPSDIESFNVKNLISIFIIYFIGVISSIGGFILEYVVYLWYKKSF